MTARLAPRFLLVAALAAGAGLAWLFTAPAAMPSFVQVRASYQSSEAWLLDRDGNVLDSRRLRHDLRRLEWTPLTAVSPALPAALVQGEDRRFAAHHGVDLAAVASALRDNLAGRGRRGASTITMQLATLLQQEAAARSPRTPGAKARQVRLALALERRWSKEEILEAYVNLLGFRHELQGVRSASIRLFGKLPSGLNAAESQVLAALLPSPGAPLERIAARACARQGHPPGSPECGYLRSLAQGMGTRSAMTETDHLAPHLSRWLLDRPGQAVRTTLDARLQRIARDTVRNHLAALARNNVRDGAALIVDNASGEVLAYVGSAGPDSRAAGVDGVRSLRQAGSTLKPFLYGLALDRRYLTPASLLLDSPLSLETPSGAYLPQDYEKDYKGLVSMRTALAGSLNIPAVRTLVMVGIEDFRDQLLRLGYADIRRDSDFYGYSLALGSAEVTLWQQAQAYRALARGGSWSAIRVKAAEPLEQDWQVISPDTSFVVGDMLSDPAARAITFGLGNHLKTPFWSAAKTGTSQDMRDNWCIGYSTRYTVAVWVGNFEGDPMRDVSGVTGAAPIWHELMRQLGGGAQAPSPPATLVQRSVRFTPAVEPGRLEWFLEGTDGQSGLVRTVPRDARPGITSPANGLIIALDPDIPADFQKVLFAADGAAAGLRFRLNDRVLGKAQDGLLWSPRPGAYQLRLEDQRGRTLDQVLFTVRGAPM